LASLRAVGARTGLKALDVAAIAAALAVVALVSVRAYAGRTGAPAVYLRGRNAEWILPLDAPRTVAVPGPLGDTVVRIEKGAVSVLSSPCNEKLCIRAGWIARPGQWIACLPNRVFIEIRGRSREPVDAYSY
jgi:hypothetical protein